MAHPQRADSNLTPAPTTTATHNFLQPDASVLRHIKAHEHTDHQSGDMLPYFTYQHTDMIAEPSPMPQTPPPPQNTDSPQCHIPHLEHTPIVHNYSIDLGLTETTMADKHLPSIPCYSGHHSNISTNATTMISVVSVDPTQTSTGSHPCRAGTTQSIPPQPLPQSPMQPLPFDSRHHSNIGVRVRVRVSNDASRLSPIHPTNVHIPPD
jgi:hypothetical protein